MRNITLVFFILCGFCLTANAQGTFQPKQYESDFNVGVVYSTERTFDARFHTNGWAVGVNMAKIKTYYLTRYVHIGLGELKHHKEQRVNLERPTGRGAISRSFIYGKQNNLFALRAGIGEKRLLSEKARRKGVAVGYSYELGASLGMLKPYYLELNRNPDLPGSIDTYSAKYSPEIHGSFLNEWDIVGSSGWSTGLSEIAFRPGIQGQIATHFDWGAFDEYVKALEVGIMFDLFLGKTDILVPVEGVENRPLFVNLFVNLQLGKRR